MPHPRRARPLNGSRVGGQANGTVNKFLKEITLVNQVFVKDEKQTIEQLLKNNNSEINDFKFFIVGEGIEKKEVDFASEVAAAQQ